MSENSKNDKNIGGIFVEIYKCIVPNSIEDHKDQSL